MYFSFFQIEQGRQSLFLLITFFSGNLKLPLINYKQISNKEAVYDIK